MEKAPSPTSQESFPLVDRLHTDVLEEKYGIITPEVIRHDDELREALLVDTQGITRTYALTFFDEIDTSSGIAEINEKIRLGGSIGKTFREHGFAIRKNVVDVFTLETSDWLRDKFRVHENFAKARLSEFYARKRNNSPVIYGTVVEAYTPDFRRATVQQKDLAQVSALTECLEVFGFSRDEIWQRIGRDNDWTDTEERLQRARELSLTKLFALRKKIDEQMSSHDN